MQYTCNHHACDAGADINVILNGGGSQKHNKALQYYDVFIDNAYD